MEDQTEENKKLDLQIREKEQDLRDLENKIGKNMKTLNEFRIKQDEIARALKEVQEEGTQATQ